MLKYTLEKIPTIEHSEQKTINIKQNKTNENNIIPIITH